MYYCNKFVLKFWFKYFRWVQAVVSVVLNFLLVEIELIDNIIIIIIDDNFLIINDVYQGPKLICHPLPNIHVVFSDEYQNLGNNIVAT